MTGLDGKSITAIVSVPWLPIDDADMRDARIIGRAMVDVEGGGRFHGLIVARSVFDVTIGPSGGPAIRRYVVVWERSTSRFVAIPMPEASR